MIKNTHLPLLFKGTGLVIALIQCFDIIIHAATDQLEPLRVASNIIILLWLAAMAFGKIKQQFVPAAIGSIGTYVVLNIIFLMLEGVTNPNQGGTLRVTLFGLVFLTTVLSPVLFINSKSKIK